ncbi:hypothetical protein MBLNU457_6251t1 [Dothideomycetes sp. NU457]
MSGRFVRASKYRHVFGQPTKKDQCYDNLRITKNAWDTNLIKANPKYISVNWEAGGGGAFAVIPVDERGKLPDKLPLFRGHTAAVLDTDWSPFDDSLIVSGSDDTKVGIYRVPEGFSLRTDADEPEDVMPIDQLKGHTRKVGHVLFSPAAANVLASSSGDYSVKIWDVEHRAAKLDLKHKDIVQSLSWSADGSQLVTTSRDKKLRFWDVRQEKPTHEVAGHSGAKNSRVVWMGEHDRVATTGFSRMSDRQLGLWDARNPTEPIGGFTLLDSISGVCMPFWDEGTNMLYLAGKGDGNIRYYEYEHDKFEYLSEYKSGDPQRGIAFLPKRGINLHENEVMRAYKTVNDAYIEPISFVVPRRAEVFQSDIYPPATGSKPAVSAEEYFAGKTGLPPKISLESLYEGQEPEMIPAAKAPSASEVKQTPAPAVTSSSKTDPQVQSVSAPSQPEPSTIRAPPPSSMNDSKSSMASMASRFADKEEDEETDGSSSFEEVPRPVERNRQAITERQEEKTGVVTPPQVDSKPTATTTSSAEAPKPQDGPSDAHRSFSGESMDTSAKATSMPIEQLSQRSATESESTSSTSTGGAKGAAEGIKGMLQEIRALLSEQGKQVAQQGEKIEILTKELAALKSKVGE